MAARRPARIFADETLPPGYLRASIRDLDLSAFAGRKVQLSVALSSDQEGRSYVGQTGVEAVEHLWPVEVEAVGDQTYILIPDALRRNTGSQICVGTLYPPPSPAVAEPIAEWIVLPFTGHYPAWQRPQVPSRPAAVVVDTPPPPPPPPAVEQVAAKPVAPPVAIVDPPERPKTKERPKANPLWFVGLLVVLLAGAVAYVATAHPDWLAERLEAMLAPAPTSGQVAATGEIRRHELALTGERAALDLSSALDVTGQRCGPLDITLAPMLGSASVSGTTVTYVRDPVSAGGVQMRLGDAVSYRLTCPDRAHTGVIAIADNRVVGEPLKVEPVTVRLVAGVAGVVDIEMVQLPSGAPRDGWTWQRVDMAERLAGVIQSGGSSMKFVGIGTGQRQVQFELRHRDGSRAVGTLVIDVASE